MESGEQKTRPAWVDVWRWSAVFACVGLVPGHVYAWHQLADGMNSEFWALFLLPGSLGGALGAIVGTIAGTVYYRDWRSCSSWSGFAAVVLAMLIVQFALAMLGMAVASEVTRAIVVSAGGLVGGCLGAWMVPAYAMRLHSGSEPLRH